MAQHAFYCMDFPKIPDDITEATRISGWLLCSAKVRTVKAKIPGLGIRKITYGIKRSDVAPYFGQYPDAQCCGFSIEVPTGFMSTPLELDIFLKVNGKLGGINYYPLKISLRDNDIHRVEFDEKHCSISTSLSTCSSLETKLKESLETKPGIILRLDLINKCNLRCIMCHFSDDTIFKRSTRKITPEEFKGFFKDLSPYVMSVMLSCGDEPLLSEHFPAILSYLAEEHPHVEIELCTNATLMNAKIRRLLIEKGVTYILLSMDGVTKKTFEKIRVGAKYEKVLSNILALRDLKRASGSRFPHMIMDYVLMNENIHEAPLFVRLSSLLGAQAIDFRHVVPSDFFNDPEQMLHNHKAKFNYYRQRIMDELKRHKIHFFLPSAYDTSEKWIPTADIPDVDLSDFERVKPDESDGKVPIPKDLPEGFEPRSIQGTATELFSGTCCYRPFSEIMIVDQEFVKPCPWYEVPLGRLSEGKALSEIFFGNAFKAVRENMLRTRGDPNCSKCPVRAQFLATEIDVSEQ